MRQIALAPGLKRQAAQSEARAKITVSVGPTSLRSQCRCRPGGGWPCQTCSAVRPPWFSGKTTGTPGPYLTILVTVLDGS